MDITEAIQKLRELKSKKQETQADNTSNAFAKALNNFKNILVGAMADLTDLLLRNEPKVTVKNFPKAFEISNLSKDGLKINNTVSVDTKNLEEKITNLQKDLQKIAPSVETSSNAQKSSFLSLEKTLKNVLFAIKAIDTTPTINIPKVEFPKFPKSIEVSNMDFGEMTQKLEDIFQQLQDNVGNMSEVRVVNTSDFPVAPSIATFKDSSGKTAQVILTSEGKVPVEITDELSGIATSANQTNGLQKTNISNTLITEPFTRIDATYPDTSTEVYTYKNGATTVGVVTVTYSDAGTKEIISSVVKS